MTHADRRHGHLPLDRCLISEFLNGRQIVSTTLFEGGKSNSNYLVELNSGEKVVVRIGSRNTQHKEAWVMNRLKNVLPVPKVFYVNNGILVLSFLPGRPLSEAPEAVYEAAKTIAKLSKLSFQVAGDIGSDGRVEPWPFAGARGFVGNIIEKTEVLKWIGSGRANRLQNVLRKESERYSELDSESKFVHGDFNPGNILVSNGGISGILDWEFALSNSPYMDIANLMRNIDEKYHAEIENGLVAGGFDLHGDWKDRAALSDIGSHLEFLTTNRSDAFKKSCVKKVEKFLQTFE